MRQDIQKNINEQWQEALYGEYTLYDGDAICKEGIGNKKPHTIIV